MICETNGSNPELDIGIAEQLCSSGYAEIGFLTICRYSGRVGLIGLEELTLF